MRISLTLPKEALRLKMELRKVKRELVVKKQQEMLSRDLELKNLGKCIT